MYHRMMVCAIALCAVLAASGGTHNDAPLPMKLVKSAGDPESLTYFRVAARRPAGALTRKTRASRMYTTPARVLHEQTMSQSATPISNGMMETKTRHSSTTFDLTVSPSFYDDDDAEEEELSEPIEEDEDRHAGGHEVDEHPGVLTRPNYPGRGKWAQRGLKHVPYVHATNPYNQKYINHKPMINPNPYNPHENLGHHILNRQRKKFIGRFPLGGVPVPSPHQQAPPRQPAPTFHINQQPQPTPPARLPIYQNFQQELQQLQDLPHPINNNHQIPHSFPQHVQPYQHIQQAYKNYQAYAPKGYKTYPKKVTKAQINTHITPEVTTEFVPTRMYAQVRHTEHESHVPVNISEPRLRQISKDARIHTVYTEEGYEDGAYDHAGEEKHAEEDEAREEHIGRERRSIDNYDSVLEVDTDFIGELKYAQGELPPIASAKYPYYNNAYINPNSPLRYAQHPNDIPNKQAGNLAFYEDREARVRCDEVVPVNPIPEELDAGGENAPVKPNVPKTPRLGKLGDQIECFRARYFGGEDPLDNPIFKESLVGAPVSILIQAPLLHEVESKLNDGTRLGKSLSPTLPAQTNNAQKEQAWDASEQTVIRQNESKPNETIIISTTTTTTTTAAPPPSAKALPEAEALRMRRIHRRPQRPHHTMKSHQTRYVSRPVYKPLHHRGTPPPLHNTLSEVYYKDQIKPSEQLNVFADVINHIQNMTRSDAYAAGSEMHIGNARPAQNPTSVMPVRTKNNNNNVKSGHDINKMQRKKRKRKHPVMKTTQELYNEFMRRSKKHPTRLYEYVNHASPNDTQMGMIHIPAEPPSGLGESQQTYYSTIEIPVNKFLVPGMKPPLAVEKPFIYADFQSENMLKRRNWLSNHRLVRRKRANRKYEQIRRRPVTKAEEQEEPDEEDDDYVPHRHKNYHYDPDTGRIVYDKKAISPSEMSVEEMINGYFEEMEEETEQQEEATTTTTPKPHRTVYHDDVLNKANGETLVDFITKLKTDPSYKPIDDPEPEVKESASPSTTTVSPKSTTPPMFLKLLEKLHHNEAYVKIEDAESKKKKTTTTEEPTEQEMKESVEEEEVEEEEEELPKNVRNSPGGQFGPDSSKLQIFDITEYLPKVKTYTPRTSIDYSKYKNIERPPSRHNFSSRYSEDEDEEAPARPLAEATDVPHAAKYQTTPPRHRRPPPDDEEIVEVIEKTDPAEVEAIVAEIADMIAATSTTTTTTTTTSTKLTQQPKIRVRQRNRTTKRPTRTTTHTVTTSTQEDEPTPSAYTPATHRSASRVYPRRNRPRVRFRSTTSTTTASPFEADDDPKEGAESRVPINHKRSYTPLTISKRMDDDSIMLVQRQPRLVTPEIISFNRTTHERRQRNPVKHARFSAPL